MRYAVAGLLLLSAGALLAQNTGLSQAKAEALGRALAADQVKRTPPILNPMVEGFLAQLAERLKLRNALTIQLVSDEGCPPLHEPRAFPGGQVFVSTMLVASARDASEVAAMLVHAGFHSSGGLLRHSGTIPLVFAGGECSDLLLPLALKPRQQQLERETDRRAVESLASAGLDATAVSRYLERLLPKNHVTTERVAVLASVLQTVRSGEADAALEEAFRAAQAEVQRIRAETVVSSGPPSLRRRRP